ncbi:MAG: site-specific DNA-methyltransferase [Chloroflexi bacterium AL-W]|nr:site-specific DNA-methyltransferase [Chloroflexi bacterium AL-N1]NOK66219.1 site-specific DNA-methyltransferase [Chloroflexi bacterium AL-N10]NOK73100.1 site-specific DNA-methyltransferase [Chloroflexi bacterium AL-N5]NOK79997.1 site-specific DNA-methyltransferase [Chloroflexi bacterium AL-W]NOK88147.1 site-specific DNA-methyltransferase [Chloroflexi bacterium AL-N15]
MTIAHPSITLPETERYYRVHHTGLGQLFQGDCIDMLGDLPAECVDLVFADPPFNLGKDYGKHVSDSLKREEYLAWSKDWLRESMRILKPGGSLFLFNLPVCLIEYGAFLNSHDMLFRHWIACRMPKAFPRGKKLSPAHYGLLYYTKGEPTTFNKVYIPIPVCRHCGKEIRDYGGHRNKLNERGLNLMDVFDAPEDVWEAADEDDHGHTQLWTPMEEMWDDIPPVRHSKYKTRGANELAPLMLERIIALSTNPGDLVFDPFGGSGTTYYAAEKLHRRWLGIEIGETEAAVQRLSNYQNGHYTEWESSRGRGKRRNGTAQLKMFEGNGQYET